MSSQDPGEAAHGSAPASAADIEPTRDAVRADALHVIHAAAEFAETLERDAKAAAAAHFRRVDNEIKRRWRELQAHEAAVEAYRNESERQRIEIVNAAREEARDIRAQAGADAQRELGDAKARGARLLEQSRHQAIELTNAARAEVEQTLDWARSQAELIIARGREAAGQLRGPGEPGVETAPPAREIEAA